LNVEPWSASRSISSQCSTLTAFAASTPAWSWTSTIEEPGFSPPRFTSSPSNLICHSTVSKRRGNATWCGGKGILAASNLSIAATPERCVERALLLMAVRRLDRDVQVGASFRVQLGGYCRRSATALINLRILLRFLPLLYWRFVLSSSRGDTHEGPSRR
jgi:hypothetical protein